MNDEERTVPPIVEVMSTTARNDSKPPQVSREFIQTPYVQYNVYGERGSRESFSSLLGCLGDKTPARLKFVNGRLTRMNLGLERTKCFGIGAGVAPALGAKTIPRDLENFMSSSEWEEIFIDGLNAVSAVTFSSGACVPFLTYLCGNLFTAMLCLPYFSARQAAMFKRYDVALRQWEIDANVRLNVKGICVKPQSNCWVWRNPGGGGKQRHIECWISIAVDPSESAALALEPYLFGDIADYSCYGGANEAEFCTHPTF